MVHRKAYLGRNQTTMMEIFAKIVPQKNSTIDIWQDTKYTCVVTIS